MPIKPGDVLKVNAYPMPVKALEVSAEWVLTDRAGKCRRRDCHVVMSIQTEQSDVGEMAFDPVNKQFIGRIEATRENEIKVNGRWFRNVVGR